MGRPQSLLVLGGSSEIANAVVRAFRTTALQRVVLAGRPGPKLVEAASALVASGVAGVTTAPFDANHTDSHDAVLDSAFGAGDIDVVLLAFGVLGDQTTFESDPDLAVEAAQVNYVGAVSVGLRVANRLRTQGHGTLVVLSSVAGERARRSNFVYGSTKAGLDLLATGLADALHGSGARVLVVRPGFVRTGMTAGRPAAPLAVSSEQVAAAVVAGYRSGRELVYVPAAMRWVMAGLRHLPRPLFRRLPL